MALLYTYTVETSLNDTKTQATIIISCAVIMSILVFCAIMTIFSINKTLHTHTVLLKEQQQDLATLIHQNNDLIRLLNNIVNQQSATNVTTPCTSATNISKSDLP